MPNAMLAATPPLRTSSWSTRKDSDTWSSWSWTSWSVNRPGKTIRWSVAIEPVTATRMEHHHFREGSATLAGWRLLGATGAILQAGCVAQRVHPVGALPGQVHIGAAE